MGVISAFFCLWSIPLERLTPFNNTAWSLTFIQVRGLTRDESFARDRHLMSGRTWKQAHRTTTKQQCPLLTLPGPWQLSFILNSLPRHLSRSLCFVPVHQRRRPASALLQASSKLLINTQLTFEQFWSLRIISKLYHICIQNTLGTIPWEVF